MTISFCNSNAVCLGQQLILNLDWFESGGWVLHRLAALGIDAAADGEDEEDAVDNGGRAAARGGRVTVLRLDVNGVAAALDHGRH